MNIPMELVALLGTVGVLWALTILQSIELMRGHGLTKAVGNREDVPNVEPGYAGRLKRAVRNHVEGMALFAPLALVCLALNISNSLTQTGCLMILTGRVLHAILYAVGVPWLRTVVFVGLLDIGFLVTAIGVVRGLT